MKWLVGLALVLGFSCQESRTDVYLRGLEIEGAAERGPCRLFVGDLAHPGSLSQGAVGECLTETERALMLYEQAATMGLADPDFVRVLDRAKARRERLQSMLRTLRQMDRDRRGPSGIVPQPRP